MLIYNTKHINPVLLRVLASVLLCAALLYSEDAALGAEAQPREVSPISYITRAEAYLTGTRRYSAKGSGTVKTSVLGAPVTQSVNSLRTVERDSVICFAFSQSKLKTVCFERVYCPKDSSAKLRHAKRIKKNGAIEWENYKNLSKNQYLDMFGGTGEGLTKYRINKSAILSFEILNNTKQEKTLRYVLDPDIACADYVKEVKTLLNSSKYPSFKPIVITLTIDENNAPLFYTAQETYTVHLMGMKLKCTSDFKEEFVY